MFVFCVIGAGRVQFGPRAPCVAILSDASFGYADAGGACVLGLRPLWSAAIAPRDPAARIWQCLRVAALSQAPRGKLLRACASGIARGRFPWVMCVGRGCAVESPPALTTKKLRSLFLCLGNAGAGKFCLRCILARTARALFGLFSRAKLNQTVPFVLARARMVSFANWRE